MTDGADLASQLPEAGPSSFFASFGMSDVDVPGADLAMQMPHDDTRANAVGALQGGLIATLIDVVAGRAALACLPDDHRVVTTDLTIHFLAPVAVGPAQAEAHIMRRGRRSIVLRVEVHDVSTHKLAAIATIGFAVFDPRGRS